MPNSWALVGAGFISQKHVDSIKDVGDKLLMVCDIDEEKRNKFPEAEFFTDYIKMSKHPLFKEVDWVAIATPNYLHFPMAMFFLKEDKNVLCEKPLVIEHSHIETLHLLPKHSQLYTVLQLRHNPELQAFKNSIHEHEKYEGAMTLNLHRGDFYGKGWKGDNHKSGGLLFNIGIHYFDLLVWFFGEPIGWEVYKNDNKSANGYLTFKNAKIIWSLSIEAPMDNQIRRLYINGKDIDLTRHFENLHTRVYEDIKMGKGITYEEAGRSIKLVEQLTKYA
jgi:UDP-N-acetyl-2-amino-2-deoxyglucuronate dehydrogenase